MTGLIEFEKNSIERAIFEIFDNYGYGKPAQNLLKNIGVISGNAGYRTFLVGGFPRDIIIYLMKSNPKTARKFKSSEVFQAAPRILDLDIAVEGDAGKLSRFIKENKDSKLRLNYLKIHKKFGTALMEFSVGNIPLKIDLASSRTEVYRKSGILPEVCARNITLKSDISRRDFTINTIAFSLNRKDFLAVKDYACGLSDVLNKKIRVLHNLSFIDDPTRMFRAVRFEKRLGFKIDKKTLKLVEIALSENVMDNISGKRITAELYLLLKEKKPEIYFERLGELNILKAVYDKLKFNEKNKKVFKKISSYCDNRGKEGKPNRVCKDIDINIFYIAEILDGMGNNELNEAVERLKLGNRIKNTLDSIYSDARKLNDFKKNYPFEIKLKNTEIYDKLKVFGINGILFYLFKDVGKGGRDSDFRKILSRYLNKIMFVKPFVNGNDIKSMGICEGVLCGKILNEIRLLKIGGKLKSKDDELKYIEKHYIKK